MFQTLTRTSMSLLVPFNLINIDDPFTSPVASLYVAVLVTSSQLSDASIVRTVCATRMYRDLSEYAYALISGISLVVQRWANTVELPTVANRSRQWTLSEVPSPSLEILLQKVAR